MRKLLTLLALHLVLAQLLKAQDSFSVKGFIVTNKGDTIHGLVKDRIDFRKMVFFSEVNDNHYKLFGPDSILSFQFDDGITYESKAVKEYNNEKIFLRRLVEGGLSLYKENSTSYFLEKSPHGLIKISDSNVVSSTVIYRSQK